MRNIEAVRRKNENLGFCPSFGAPDTLLSVPSKYAPADFIWIVRSPAWFVFDVIELVFGDVAMESFSVDKKIKC